MIGKGPALNAAAAGASGDGDVEVDFASAGDAVEPGFVRDVGALAREGSGATVEDGGVGWVGSVFGPVPVSCMNSVRTMGGGLIGHRELTADILCSRIPP